MTDIKQFHFITSCALGLEDLVYQEIIFHGGAEVERGSAVVSWRGTLETAYRLCLWSRFASKILLRIQSFPVTSEEDLYLKTKKVAWCEHFNESMTFAVSSTLGVNPVISHSQFAALRVKDGIVDYFRGKGLKRPDVARRKPHCRVHLHLHGNEALLYIDFSGDSLHKRGYRERAGEAPIKETLAAAIVRLAGWDSDVSAMSTFLDPMCGSGTLLIEAALLWGNSAPGLSRTYYGFSRWLGHDEKSWSRQVEEALNLENQALAKRWPRIVGYDCDSKAVAIARKNIAKAGLEDKIEVGCLEVGRLKPHGESGFVVSNLPYGERLSDKSRVGYLYSCLDRILRSSFSGWHAGLLVSEPDLTDRFGLQEREKYKLHNGPISCRLVTGIVKREESKTYWWKAKKAKHNEEGTDFANRLRKNHKKIGNWAQKNNISCFRLYDRDLPEFNVSIDFYHKWIVVQEFMPPPSIDSDLAQKRLSTVLYTIRDIFGVGRDRVFLRQRKRQKGRKQYQKKAVKPRFHVVKEGTCYFLVNLTNYLDTGLFLDHRPIRSKIGTQVKGKRFLNLFGYTGTATVHAARGGASQTTTVDRSSTYLEWAENNLALNGFSLQNHELVKQNCLAWLKEHKGVYDVIFIDPPTFSNTKKKDLMFDLQKHHVELLCGASRLLEKQGVLWFSTNFRGFRLDSGLEKIFTIKNISKETIPYDFQRKASIHKCWEMRLP